MIIKNIMKNFAGSFDIEQYPDAVIIINAMNEVIAWNTKSENIFGYLKNEIVGRNLAIVFDDNIDKIHTSLATKETQVITAKKRDGSDIIIEITCNQISKDAKTLITLRDVTKSQKVIEKLLLEYERASKIAHNKSGFIAAYSKELKKPIHAIIGFSQGIIDGVCGKIDEKQEKYISIINKNANNLLMLIENMINLSKMEADLIQLDYKVFDVQDFVEGLKNDISHLLEEKNITFETDYSGMERKNIYSDESLLRQILLNLYTNAIKFTNVGQIRVELSHPDMELIREMGIIPAHYFTERSYVMFSISDTGIGISDDDKPEIFDEYNQAKSMTKKYGGTGLGLPITKKLVHLLGGNVWFTSKLSHGSTFNFIIPVDKIITPIVPKTAE